MLVVLGLVALVPVGFLPVGFLPEGAGALVGAASQEPARGAEEREDDRPRFDREAPRPKDADALFGLFSKLEGLEVSFVEEKHLELLFEPLETKGKLYFLRPAHLARVVKEPRPSTVVIGPKELVVRGEDGEEVVDLRQNEAVRVFVTSLVRIFAGDRDELARFYEIEYLPSKEEPADWTLRLVPREEIVPVADEAPGKRGAREPERNPLADMVRELRVSGTGTVVERIEIDEPNGDRTVTRILASDAEREFTAKERRELFGLEDEQPPR